jgi:F-type H+-transporting ATPase subunit gamma
VASTGQLRRLRRRIRSVKSTQQITRAMEMIAASRINRAVRRVEEAVPYARMIHDIIRGLAASAEAISHPLLAPHEEVRTVALCVNTSDRGLAGAYNANVLRRADIARERLGHDNALLYVSGRKGISAYRFRRVPVEARWSGFSDSPGFEHSQPIAQKLIEDFLEEKIASATIVYTHFESMLVQRTAEVEILPLEASELAGGRAFPPVYEFEPAPSAILDGLLPMYVEMKIYHVLMEAAASEHAARQKAMRAATDNAEELIQNLTRVMNQARQAEITAEIADIVGGAEALRVKAEAGIGG